MQTFNFNLTHEVNYRANIKAPTEEKAREILEEALEDGDWGHLDIYENDCTDLVIELSE